MSSTAHSPDEPVGVGSPRQPRTLVLCFDGTSDEFCKQNSNVIKLHSILKKDGPKTQPYYYQAGSGTYFQPGVVSPLFRITARILDEAVAWYLSEHIMNGYKFLMQNYHEGDTVCMFGFSRPTHIDQVALLSKGNFEQVSFTYKLYNSRGQSAKTLAMRFKKALSREVPIEFLGVWDTVASVGIINRSTRPSNAPFRGNQ
ncbi:hypothetical protein BC827DRAFT_263451 [Russula dissimulans]|nr:hypothetical protein BC827DRAFT_263451 [Russula dissimulans]